MKVFTDPVSKIPPLLESDIKTKIIISKMYINDILIMNYMIKNQYGMIITKDHDIKNGYDVIWSNDYAWGKTMLDVIIKQYKLLLPRGYKMSYYVIESKKELKTFIKQNQITNTELETELLELWKKLKENKK
ncbi:MAG: hypothetical protein WC929_00535 [Bacilli bacterium]|jgi:hypothetical protein